MSAAPRRHPFDLERGGKPLFNPSPERARTARTARVDFLFDDRARDLPVTAKPSSAMVEPSVRDVDWGLLGSLASIASILFFGLIGAVLGRFRS